MGTETERPIEIPATEILRIFLNATHVETQILYGAARFFDQDKKLILEADNFARALVNSLDSELRASGSLNNFNQPLPKNPKVTEFIVSHLLDPKLLDPKIPILILPQGSNNPSVTFQPTQIADDLWVRKFTPTPSDPNKLSSYSIVGANHLPKYKPR